MRGRAGFRVTANDDDLFDRDSADSGHEESSRGTDEVKTHFDGLLVKGHKDAEKTGQSWSGLLSKSSMVLEEMLE